MATAPTLALGPLSATQQLFDTGWEDAPDAGANLQPVLVKGSVLDGWNLITQEDQHPSEQSGFEVWASGDTMKAADGQSYAVSAAPGDGSKFLELDSTGEARTLGIRRQVSTVAGDTYALSFDLAGQLGFDAASTSISILIDGEQVASYDPTSPDTALNWQHANISFVGTGANQTISIVATHAKGHDGHEGHDGHDGTMIDNIALSQIQPLDVGNQGSSIALQSIDAALIDTDGSETLQLALAGLPVGSMLTDGTYSFTVTAAQPVANITGWHTGALSITPPADYNGMLTLQLTATAAESVGGSSASISQNLTVEVDAIAQVPTLTLTPATGSVSRNLNFTHWEGANPTDNNADQPWLELTNGADSQDQAPGIAQNINTLAGAQYTFSFDYAGQLGLSSANTQIGVYLDSQLLGTYSNASVNSLNWQTLHYSFQGDGAAHTLSVQLINGTDTRTARGAMINAPSLIETLPQSAGTVYGFAGSPIALPQITAQLAAHDPGQLTTTLLGLPAGAIVSDGKNSLTIQSDDTPLNLTGWNLNRLTLSVPNDPETENSHDNHSHTLNLQIIATSVEPANGSMARIAQHLTVQWLSGQACATPVGVNPYVSYINPPAISQILKPHSNPIIVASPLMPVSSNYPATALLPQWSAYSDLNQDSDQDDDTIKIKPVMDWSAHPDDFLFDDGASAWSDGGSSWLSGFLGTDKTTMLDAASLSNLSVILSKDSATAPSE